MPHDNMAEQAVIGSMLYDNACIDQVRLSPDDFYSNANRMIYVAIMELSGSGKVADLVTVCDHLGESVKKCGGPAYVAEVIDAVVSASAVESYADIVKQRSIERRIITEAGKMINAVYDQSQHAKAKLEEAQKAIMSLSFSDGDTLKTCREVLKKSFTEIERRYEAKGDLIGISSGIYGLDKILSGLIGGNLIILAARPSTGKSAVAGNIAANVSAGGNTTAIFSLEMSSVAVMMRILGSRSGLNIKNLNGGYMSESDWPKVTTASSEISEWNLFFDDKPDITPQEIRAKARKLKKEHDLKLLIVDYIQLIRPNGKHDSREQAVADISRTLKAIAIELDIPVIALAQLNRQVELRQDKHPIMSDLRESGSIEQDADVIIFLYRDDMYNKSEDNENKGLIEFDIAKQRNGETARFKAIYNKQTQTIKNLARPPWENNHC